MGAERRRYTRVPFRGYFEVEKLYTADGVEIGEYESNIRVIDISVGGLGLVHGEGFAEPCILKGKLLFEGTKHKAIVQIARCQRANNYEYNLGGEFLDMSRQLGDAIKKHVFKVAMIMVK